jgi:hypothetical protein
VALRQALLRREPLPFGALLSETIAEVEQWSAFPADVLPGELQQRLDDDYEQRWKLTVEEMLGLLDAGRTAISQGSLAVDAAALDDLGATERRTNGAGTVTAAAAIFLASRHAADPRQALVAAAFARGADTDTLASMAGGLLGALHGEGFLADLADRVQDAGYIRNQALSLLDGQPAAREPFGHWTSNDTRSLKRQLSTAEEHSTGRFGPLGQATVVRSEPLPSSSDSVNAHRVLLDTSEGQTVAVLDVRRDRVVRGQLVLDDAEHEPTDASNGSASGTSEHPRAKSTGAAPKKAASGAAEDHIASSRLSGAPPNRPSPTPARLGAIFYVDDLGRSEFFYERILGLTTRRSERYLSLADQVLLEQRTVPSRQADSLAEDPQQARELLMVIVAPAEFEKVHRMAVDTSVYAQPLRDSPIRAFRCLDPDGHVVEVREDGAGVRASANDAQ